MCELEKIFLVFLWKVGYSVYMIKIKDVVTDSRKRILQVEGFHKDGAETFVLARIYRSQKRVAVPLSSVKLHPFFA